MDPGLLYTLIGIATGAAGWGLRALVAARDETIRVTLKGMGGELAVVRDDVKKLLTRDAQRDAELQAIKSDIDELKGTKSGRGPGWRRT